MEKRFNFRIYPNQAQEIQIQKNFGCCRFVYNYYLARQIERYQQGGEYGGLFDVTRDLPVLKRTAGFEWLQEADAASLSYALCDLDNAYKRFFRNVRQGNVAPGFPKFKSKKVHHQSYRCKNRPPSPGKFAAAIELNDKGIKLPKLGWVACRVSRKVEGRILSVTIIQQPSGKYCVSVYCTDFTPAELPPTGQAVGLHLGIHSLVSTSAGQQFDNRRFLEKSQQKLARRQRQLSRKSSGSHNREKARIKYARAFERVSRQKTDMLHKLTTQLVRDYDTIVVHEISVQAIMRRRVSARYLADASWSRLMRQLSYKCAWYGKTLVKVDELFPSAQLCSACGFKNAKVKRRADWQEWNCPQCGAHHHRGVNSARNIFREGMRWLEQRETRQQNDPLALQRINAKTGRTAELPRVQRGKAN